MIKVVGYTMVTDILCQTAMVLEVDISPAIFISTARELWFTSTGRFSRGPGVCVVTGCCGTDWRCRGWHILILSEYIGARAIWAGRAGDRGG